jgi:hypothetical protein
MSRSCFTCRILDTTRDHISVSTVRWYYTILVDSSAKPCSHMSIIRVSIYNSSTLVFMFVMQKRCTWFTLSRRYAEVYAKVQYATNVVIKVI